MALDVTLMALGVADSLLGCDTVMALGVTDSLLGCDTGGLGCD